MSKRYDPSSDYRNWWNLGQWVHFDGPYGERMYGEIVRVYPGADLHVLVDGVRYEVNTIADNVTIDWSRE